MHEERRRRRDEKSSRTDRVKKRTTRRAGKDQNFAQDSVNHAQNRRRGKRMHGTHATTRCANQAQWQAYSSKSKTFRIAPAAAKVAQTKAKQLLGVGGRDWTGPKRTLARFRRAARRTTTCTTCANVSNELQGIVCWRNFDGFQQGSKSHNTF